jgi:hypothetical protein
LTREYGFVVRVHRQKSFHVSGGRLSIPSYDNTYQSQTIKAGDQFMNIRVTGEVQATVARYPGGVSGIVYYNLENPAESTLER